MCRQQQAEAGDVTADITDEGFIDADPEVVYRAVVDVHNGTTDWWEPYYSMKLGRGASYDEVGTLLANPVRVHGRFPIMFTTETIEVEPGKAIGGSMSMARFAARLTGCLDRWGVKRD